MRKIIKKLKNKFFRSFNFFRFHKLMYRNNLLDLDFTTKLEINPGASYRFGKKLSTRKGVEIYVRENAKLTIGEGVFFNRFCMIVCRKNIYIGSNTIFGPNVHIYDHDHIYGENGVEKTKFNTTDIYIGENCWIGAGTIILRGAHIGDNSVVGAGSLITGYIPNNSLFYQKRERVVKNLNQ